MNENVQNENKKRGRKRKNIINSVEPPLIFDYNFTGNATENNIQLIIEELALYTHFLYSLFIF